MPYHEGSRSLQDRFDTRRLADRIDERLVHDVIDEDDRAFVEGCDMFFIATADAEGRPQCSYKGGEPGFVRVVDERTIAFPVYDGNGMYLTAGNALVNPQVGLLFIDFERRRRMRLERGRIGGGGRPAARRVPRGAARRPRARRPRSSRTARATSTSTASWSGRGSCPAEECSTPAPAWKTREWARDVLPHDDPATTPGVEVVER